MFVCRAQRKKSGNRCEEKKKTPLQTVKKKNTFECFLAAHLVNWPYCYATVSFSHIDIDSECFGLQFIRLCHNNILYYILKLVGISHAMKWHKLLLNMQICRTNNHNTNFSNRPWRLLIKNHSSLDMPPKCVLNNIWKIAIHFTTPVGFRFALGNIAPVYRVVSNPFKLGLLFGSTNMDNLTENNKNKRCTALS